jgi:prepilin-type N-terminal cleavage/methylation domain-containing protein
MHHGRRRVGFTIIELLVVVSIVAILLSILMPAAVKARDAAKITQSRSNLRNLGAAHAAYSADFNDRQWTVVEDDFGSYIGCADYISKVGCPPVAVAGTTSEGQVLAWGDLGCGEGWTGSCLNWKQLWPIRWPPDGVPDFGSFRYNNVQSFNSYVNGRFYDPIFWAPKDVLLLEQAEFGFQDPGQIAPPPSGPLVAVLMSYVLSPAAMWSPDVLAPPSRGGFNMTIPGRFRSPPTSMARYPELKTRMLEHHWLQGPPGWVNPDSADGNTGYFFNQGMRSTPVTLFFDGHIDLAGVADALAADSRALKQSGEGLWSRDTPFGEQGYFGASAVEEGIYSSFHILTTEGILGRDLTGSE